jgi:hypothetical protein
MGDICEGMADTLIDIDPQNNIQKKVCMELGVQYLYLYLRSIITPGCVLKTGGVELAVPGGGG